MRKTRRTTPVGKKVLAAGAGFLFFVLIIASLFGERGLVEVYRTKKKQERLLQRIAVLEEEKAKLARDIQELRSNPRAVEEKAREKLGLVQEGEIVIVDKTNR